MARRKKKEEHINHERWLVSYADFITLLFAFFTSLYAISTVDAKKAGKLVFSTRAAFNVDFFPSDKPAQASNNGPVSDVRELRPTTEAVTPQKEKKKKKEASSGNPEVTRNKHLRQVFEQLETLRENNTLAGVQVSLTGQGLLVSLKEAAFFNPGKTSIRPASVPLLDLVASKILPLHLDIRVEGHTDDTPAKKGRHHSNWEISTERAISVVRYFTEEYAYPPESLSLAGYASYRPISSNATAQGRAANRRVDIVLLAPHIKFEESTEEDPEPNSLVQPAERGLQAPSPSASPPSTPSPP